MSSSLVLNLSALAALMPVSLASLRWPGARDRVYWMLLAVAAAGPITVAATQLAQGWLTGLATALWISVAASMLLFVLLASLTREAWRLTPLLVPYLLLLGIGATAAGAAPSRHLVSAAPAAWLDLHILVSVATYGLLTIAAVAALSVFVQERALKRKRQTALSRILPSVADGEDLEVRLLTLSEIILGLGLLTGMATEFMAKGKLLPFDHKTVFSLLAFATIGLLLVMRRRTGFRGRQAARIVLVAYLFLTLAYPGVKFVTDVLLA